MRNAMNYYVFIQSGEPRDQKPIYNADRRMRLAEFSGWQYPYSAIAKETETTMEAICEYANRDGLKGFVFRITQDRMIDVNGLPGAACKLFDIPTMRKYSDLLCAV